MPESLLEKSGSGLSAADCASLYFSHSMVSYLTQHPYSHIEIRDLVGIITLDLLELSGTLSGSSTVLAITSLYRKLDTMLESLAIWTVILRYEACSE